MEKYSKVSEDEVSEKNDVFFMTERANIFEAIARARRAREKLDKTEKFNHSTEKDKQWEDEEG
jgi:hypothetical protein